MSLDDDLFTLVQSDGTITGLISTRFYPTSAPQQAAKPYAVYQRISTPRDYVQTGASGLSWPRYQITSIASTDPGARALADAFRALLSGYSGTPSAVRIDGIFLDNEADTYHDGLDEWITRQDYIVYHLET